jgi:hypothetical protein
MMIAADILSAELGLLKLLSLRLGGKRTGDILRSFYFLSAEIEP